MLKTFDDIRPYQDAEIPAAMQRIVCSHRFPAACAFLFPEMAQEQVKARLLSCQTVDEFQARIMYALIGSIARRTTEGLTASGLDALEPDKPYLFVSNHRDIMLDAGFMQMLLADAGLKTSEITFGANLMQGQLLVDLGRSNKMFRFERPTTATSHRDFLTKIQHVSDYIRYTITRKKESVWIAQRNGRTKDGLDATDQGIINMFCLSGGEDRGESLGELHMVPVAISYEWEPCDKLKALELFAREGGEAYEKKPGEDLNSILTGITQPKGRVHLAVGKPITTEELKSYKDWSTGEYNRQVASLIDQSILASYRLYPNNYIAAWLLCGRKLGDFTPEEQQRFEAHVDAQVKGCPEKVRDILLHIYANPVLRTL